MDTRACFLFIILLYNLLAAFLSLKVVSNSLPTEGLCIPPLWAGLGQQGAGLGMARNHLG